MVSIIRIYRTRTNVTGAVLEAADGTRFARFLGAGLTDEQAAAKVAELFGEPAALTLDRAVEMIEAAGLRVWRGGEHARVYVRNYRGYYDIAAIVDSINAGEYSSNHDGIVGKPRARERYEICEALFGVREVSVWDEPQILAA